jgi:lipid II:glycine glycyltransferase (peptidoglycan interpeptide bridge formation enzyme)
LNARDARPDELVDWDAQAVEAPGGHVYQSVAWAEHRRASGWSPRFLVTDDGGRILALTRRWRWVAGGGAYLPRGPVPAGGGATPEALAERQIAVSEALARDGVDVVAADPEVPADQGAYRATILAAGFRPIEEIQPSRHRVTLPLRDAAEALPGRPGAAGPAGEVAVFDAIAKSTRQRIRGAERDGLLVVRHDSRAGPDGAGEGFVDPSEPPSVALDRFYGFLLETGERRHFSFGPRSAFVRWWLAALAAGHLVYLEARPAGGPTTGADEPLAGLVVYRHGRRLSTVHSADHAAARAEHPGALHLLRWRAIQLAIREGCDEMDLGGVDVAGSRGEPREGDPLYGLYQHKRAFGGRWLELTGAHERVFDRRGYAFGRLAGRVSARLRR